MRRAPARGAAEGGGDLAGHPIGVGQALGAGAGVRAAAVDDDGAGDALAALEMALRDQ